MKYMKMRKIVIAVSMAMLVALSAGCGRNSGQTSSTEVPIDLVSEIAGAVSTESETTVMDATVQKNYQVLLDGTSDADAVYYLVDVTGNGLPELIVGKENMSVYSCNQGEVTTIGSMAIDTAYLSQQYGFLAYSQQNQYELRQYKYDGEMIVETVLVSAASEADYKSQAASYLTDAQALTPYALDDRTPFGEAE